MNDDKQEALQIIKELQNLDAKGICLYIQMFTILPGGREAVLNEPSFPEDILLKAMEDPDVDLRQLIAWCHLCPEAAMLKAIRDESWFVRTAVAENRYASKKVLAWSIRDENVFVRAAAASNWAATEEVLLTAISDSSKNVRYLAAHNPSATIDVLRIALGEFRSDKLQLKLMGLTEIIPMDWKEVIMGQEDK